MGMISNMGFNTCHMYLVVYFYMVAAVTGQIPLNYSTAQRHCYQQGKLLADQHTLQHLIKTNQIRQKHSTFWIPTTRYLLLHWRSLHGIDKSGIKDHVLTLSAQECNVRANQDNPRVRLLCHSGIKFACANRQNGSNDCPVNNKCIYTERRVLIVLHKTKTIPEARRICTNITSSGYIPAIIADGINKNYSKEIDELHNKGLLMFGYVTREWMPDSQRNEPDIRTEWGDGEPSSDLSKSCATMSGTTLKLKATPCNSSHTSICVTQDDSVTRHINPTTVRMNIYISTDEPLTITTPTTELTTTSIGHSVLIISISVPVGLVILIVVAVTYIVISTRKQKSRQNASSKPNLAEVEKHNLEPLLQNVPSEPSSAKEENVHMKPLLPNSAEEEKPDLDPLQPKDICNSTTIEELKKTAENPNYATVNERLNSFNNWVFKDVQSADTLADSGFFYEGPGDKVKCFMCSLGLDMWEKNDIPWDEHVKAFRDCPFVEAYKDVPAVKKAMQKAEKEKITRKNSPEKIICKDVKREEVLCMRCQKNTTNCLFKPCSHTCCCWDCGTSTKTCFKCNHVIRLRIPITLPSYMSSSANRCIIF